MKGQNRRGRKMSCEWVSQHIDAYLDGELNQARADKVRAHLDVCPACAAQAEEGREIRALIASCEDVTPDAALHEAIMQSVRQQPREAGKPTSLGRRAKGIGAALVGACLVLALVLLPGSLFRANAPQEPPAEDRPSANTPGDNKPDCDGSFDNEDMKGPSDDSEADKDENCFPVPPSEEPEEPNYGTELAPMGVVLELTRDETVSGGTTTEGDDSNLLLALEGEWSNDTIYLYLYMSEGEVYWSTDDYELCGDVSLQGDELLLQFENGLRMVFEVRLEGDTLWLTRLS